MSEAQLKALDTETERAARMKANRTDTYIQVNEKFNYPFMSGLIYDYKKTTPEIKLLPGFIEGTPEQCALQAQYLYSKIKSNERTLIENNTLTKKPGFVLKYIDDKNNCGDIDSCYISDFNNNKEIPPVSIIGPGSCTITGHTYIEVFCYFKPAKSGKWKISSDTIKGADKFKLWIKQEKAVYDHLYVNADLKSVGETMTIFLNKNIYYPLRIHVIGQFTADQTTSNLAPFSLLDMFKYNGTEKIDNTVKLENMFTLILNKNGSVYKPNLVYYGLVQQPALKNSPPLYKCYFVDPNYLNNFSAIERLKYNCPDFLVKREQVKITLGSLLAEYTGKENTKLTSAPNFKYVPPYGDINSMGGTAQILKKTIQVGTRTDIAKFNAAIVKYDADLIVWKQKQQDRHNAWLRFWRHFGSWWTFNWNKYRDTIRNTANAAAKKITDTANSAKRALEDAVKRADAQRRAAEANWKKYRDLWNSFYAQWQKWNAAKRKANQAKYNQTKKDSDNATVAKDSAIKSHEAAIVANNKPQPVPVIPAPAPDDPGAIELQKSFVDLASYEAERKKMMDAYLLLVQQQSQTIEASALDALGLGASAGRQTALPSNKQNESKDIGVKYDPVNVDPKTGKRLDTKTSTQKQGYRNYQEGFSEGLSRPNEGDFQIPIMKTYNPVSTTKTHIRVTPKSIEAQKPDWEMVENTEFPRSKNFAPEHPGQRYVEVPLTITVDGKLNTRLYIESGKPMLSYYETAESTEPTKVPLSKTIRTAQQFKIWDEPPPVKGRILVPGEIDLKFGDLYVVCGNSIDPATGAVSGSLSYARLPCFGFTVPARNNISPNDFWVKTDLAKCSSSRGRPASATFFSRGNLYKEGSVDYREDTTELISPRGYFLLSFEKKDDNADNYYLYMKFGAKKTFFTSTADTYSNTPTGAPILSLLRPTTTGLSDNIYQKTTYKDTGLSEARVIPRTFNKMMEARGFTEQNGRYFQDEIALKSALGIKYKIDKTAKNKNACSQLCKPDQNCHHYFYETQRNPKDNRCILDQNATVRPMSTFKSPSASITGSVLGTKQLQTLANKSTKVLYDAYNQRPISNGALGYNTDVIYNDLMIRDDDRYVGWAISSEINDQVTKVNNAWTINQLPIDGQPVSGIEGFYEGATDPSSSIVRSYLTDNTEDSLLNNVASANAKQIEYIRKFKDANDYISKYHTAQRDLYGTEDVINQQNTTSNKGLGVDGTYDPARDAKGALFIYKTNDSEYVIPSKFTVKPPDDSTTPVTTVEDARQEDLTELLLQQNSLYTIGTLTAATFLMTAIVLARD